MNATVTMPLIEIDNLRGELQQAEARVKKLESTEKKVLLQIVENNYTQGYDTVTFGGYACYIPNSNKNGSRIVKTEYINMDEVIKPIREEEEAKVADVIQTYKMTVKERDKTILRIKENYAKEINDLKVLHKKEITLITGEALDECKDNKINQLARNVQILQDHLRQIREQGFFGRLFNPIK